jgi:hypothetical protein
MNWEMLFGSPDFAANPEFEKAMEGCAVNQAQCSS